MIKVNKMSIRNGVKNGQTDMVKNGIECVWDLTVSSWSMIGNFNAESRLQRNVIVAKEVRR
jgi:hypothetical protein